MRCTVHLAQLGREMHPKCPLETLSPCQPSLEFGFADACAQWGDGGDGCAYCVGLIPSSFVYIYAGAMGADAAENNWGAADWAIAVGGGIATVGVSAKSFTHGSITFNLG